MSRPRLALVACAVMLAVAGVAWGGFHTRVRVAFWDRVALRALGADDHREMEECLAPGWWTLVKVVDQDLDAPCGEPWVVEAIAARVKGSRDRVAWLALRADAAPPSRAFRSALALAVAGESVPIEPAAWLARGEVPAPRSEAILAAAGEGAPWAAQLGQRGLALALAGALTDARVARGDALPALAWLSAVGHPEAEQAVSRAAAAALGVDDTWLAAARVGSGRPSWQVPDAWRGVLLAHRSCETGACGSLWVNLLSLPGDELEPNGGAPAAAPVGEARLDRLARLTGAGDDEILALDWGIDAATAWVSASPDPAARLRSLAAASTSAEPAPFARTLWDGAGSPFAVAAVVAGVARRVGVPVSVRSAGNGVVWVRVGDRHVVARAACGVIAGSAPSDVEWPVAAVEAAALTELATVAGADGPRIAAAAARLDPLVGAGLVDQLLGDERTPDLRTGLAVGEALARPIAPPSGAVEERRRYGSTPRPPCEKAVMN